MQTVWRNRTWGPARRRTPSIPTAPRSERLAEISPLWEVSPRGHKEVGARHDVLRRDVWLRRWLGVADMAAAYISLVTVFTVFDTSRFVHLQIGVLLVGPFLLLAGKVIGLYDRDQHVIRKTTIDELPSILYLSVVFALVTWLGESVIFQSGSGPERGQVFALMLETFALVAFGRILVRWIAGSRMVPERCVVIGDRVDAVRIASKFRDAPAVNAVVIGRVALRTLDLPAEMASEAVPTLGDCGVLGRVVAEHRVERAIIAPGADGEDEILDAIRMIKALGVKVSVLPRLLEVVGSSSTFDDIDGMWLLGVRQYGLARSSELLKRAMDVTAAGLGLLVLGPLFLMLTLAVRFDSPGPVFFRQRRIGRRGENFSMLKFRSMVDGADGMKDQIRGLNEVQGGLFKITSDPRITRTGAFLRRTSLDELPQLINVLRGDMSLVGPRPLVPDEDALIEGWQRRRLAVKPGMTGMWQIFGSSRIPMHEMVKIDYIYGANWSLWLDLRILLRTIPYMLARRGM